MKKHLDPLVILYAFAVSGLLLLAVYLLCSCCRTPECPLSVQHLTTVMSTCQLPPGPGKLLGAVRTGADAGCPTALVCYDVANAAVLADRNSRLVQWISETKARCHLDRTPSSSVDSGREHDAPANTPADAGQVPGIETHPANDAR